MPRGKRRREQQRAAGVRRGLEDGFQILAKAQIEHFIGFVEHDGFQFRDVEIAAPQVVAQPPRRSDNDMRAVGKLALFAARVHAADAGNDARAGVLIEPREFALHLQGKLSRRRDDQCQRLGASFEAIRVAEKILRNRQPIGNGLARAGLRRDQQIAVDGCIGKHRRLHGRRLGVAALGQGSGELRTCRQECHEMSDLDGLPYRMANQTEWMTDARPRCGAAASIDE